ncbi:hypothetical protein Tco_0250095, partial [Tanacetum coccineum]
PNSEKLVEAFIGGLPQSIEGNVTASKPQTLEEATNIAHRLMDQIIKRNSVQETNDHKRKIDDRRNTNNNNYPMIATTIITPIITLTKITTQMTVTITTATIITISSKMEGMKSLRLMEIVDIMDLIPFVGSVLCITQDRALLGVRIATK